MSQNAGLKSYRTTRRSIGLLRAFRQEQPRPELFYGPLATDTANLVEHFHSLQGSTVLDIGAGPAQFAREFGSRGARYVALEVVREDLDREASAGVVGRGQQLPFADDSLDVAMSSNVLEHVPDPDVFSDEMVRVTRPGGLIFLSYTLWLSPWGGHETSPWHYLGGDYAARRYERTHGHPPKNRFGTSMFAASMADGLAWAREQTGAEVLFTGPRYAPWWLQWVTGVPGVREVVGWNLLMVLRKHGTPDARPEA